MEDTTINVLKFAPKKKKKKLQFNMRLIKGKKVLRSTVICWQSLSNVQFDIKAPNNEESCIV